MGFCCCFIYLVGSDGFGFGFGRVLRVWSCGLGFYIWGLGFRCLFAFVFARIVCFLDLWVVGLGLFISGCFWVFVFWFTGVCFTCWFRLVGLFGVTWLVSDVFVWCLLL